MGATPTDSDTDDLPPAPTAVKDLNTLAYSQKQQLAAANDYGRIVGVQESDLDEFLVETFDLSSDEQQRDGEDSEPERGTQNVTNSESTDESTEPQTDAVTVGHEGKEKLSPENAPDDEGTAVEPPTGVELDGMTPDDLEADADTTADQGEDSRDAGEPSKRNQSDDSDEDSGLLDLIRGDSDRSAEDIVEDAPTEEERQRREEVRDTFSQSFGSSDEEVEESIDAQASSTSDPMPAGTQQASGMVVDESVVRHLIGMPFSSAAAMTGWDGWELSEKEKAANAELFVAMCDEHDVEVGPTVMFAVSMAGTAGGRMMRYRQQRDTADTPTDEPPEEPAEFDDVESVPGGWEVRETPEQPTEQTEDSGEFDFEDSSNW